MKLKNVTSQTIFLGGAMWLPDEEKPVDAALTALLEANKDGLWLVEGKLVELDDAPPAPEPTAPAADGEGAGAAGDEDDPKEE
jgi:hypothetical protein